MNQVYLEDTVCILKRAFNGVEHSLNFRGHLCQTNDLFGNLDKLGRSALWAYRTVSQTLLAENASALTHILHTVISLASE
jgi:hypothetical protein